MATNRQQGELVIENALLRSADKILCPFPVGSSSAWTPDLRSAFLSLKGASATDVLAFANTYGVPWLCGLHGKPVGHLRGDVTPEGTVRDYCALGSDGAGDFVRVSDIWNAAAALASLFDLLESARSPNANDRRGLVYVQGSEVPDGRVEEYYTDQPDHQDDLRRIYGRVWEWFWEINQDDSGDWTEQDAPMHLAEMLTVLLDWTRVKTVARWDDAQHRTVFDVECPDVLGTVAQALVENSPLNTCVNCGRRFAGRSSDWCQRDHCRKARKAIPQRARRADGKA